MKKTLFLFISIFFATVLMAQESEVLTSKKGNPILPKAGDIAFGMDATPFIDLVGNLIKLNSGAAFASPALVSFMPGTPNLFFKYYTTSSSAYRVGIRIAKSSTTTKTDVPSVADPLVMVVDKSTSKYGLINLTAGIEYKKGKGRVRGIYGAEGILNLSNGSVFAQNVSNSYADALSALNPGTRTLSSKAGMTVGVGARGFVGAEWFFAPKICLSGEFGWGFVYEMQLDGKSKVENWTGTAVDVTETSFSNGSSFNMDADTMGGFLSILFHF